MELRFEDIPNALSQLLNDVQIIKGFISQAEPKTKSPNSNILSVKQTAKLLKLHPVTIYNKINNGCLPAFKRGKQWYLFEDELLNYLKTGLKNSQVESIASIDSYLEKRVK